MPAEPITIFSDFTCPFSYVTEAALRRALSGEVRVVAYRAFELYPAPVPLPPRATTAQPWEDALRPLAREIGVELRPALFTPRTRKAHEAARFAAERGVGDAMRDAIFAAYWAGGADIGRIDVLSGLAERLELDPTDLRIALDVDAFAAAVAGDQLAAERLGVRHTPTLIAGTGSDARVSVGALSLGELRALLDSE